MSKLPLTPAEVVVVAVVEPVVVVVKLGTSGELEASVDVVDNWPGGIVETNAAAAVVDVAVCTAGDCKRLQGALGAVVASVVVVR